MKITNNNHISLLLPLNSFTKISIRATNGKIIINPINSKMNDKPLQRKKSEIIIIAILVKFSY